MSLPAAGSPAPAPAPVWRPFVFGAIAGVTATTVVQPIDTVKVWVQLSGAAGFGAGPSASGSGSGSSGSGSRSNSSAAVPPAGHIHSSRPWGVATQMWRTGGVRAMYAGYSAALSRQLTYGMGRLGLYDTLTARVARSTPATHTGGSGCSRSSANPPAAPTLAARVGIGVVAGVSAACLGTPSDVVLVRMQSAHLQPLLPPSPPPPTPLVSPALRASLGMPHAVTAAVPMASTAPSTVQVVRQIVGAGGWRALWSGNTQVMARAGAINGAMLSTADAVKTALVDHRHRRCHHHHHHHSATAGPAAATGVESVISSCCAGFTATAAALPFDLLAVRRQASAGAAGAAGAAVAVACQPLSYAESLRVVYANGWRWQARCFAVLYCRLTPHAVVTFLVLDTLKSRVPVDDYE